jgi:hypothetical protein
MEKADPKSSAVDTRWHNNNTTTGKAQRAGLPGVVIHECDFGNVEIPWPMELRRA